MESYKYDIICHKAYSVAEKYHKNQVDKAGKEYMSHLTVVASSFMAQDLIVVALLHDVLEDTPCTEADLLRHEIPEDLIASVKTLTRKHGEPYFEYIARVKQDPRAVEVKLADLKHNMDESRFANPADYPLSLRKRYAKAIALLKS